jgi:RNA polymerase sigma-70 factor (ECF subfamily)
VCRVPTGTVKSRVNRARLKLAYLRSLSNEAELGPKGPPGIARH